MVKQQTGSDKVNLAFISLGGTIGNVYLAKYCNPDDINRIVFAAAAVNGSNLLGDMMKGAVTLDDPKALYNDVLPNMLKLLSEDNLWLGYLGNILMRFIPNKVFSDFLTELTQRVLNEVTGNIMYNCPSMWALVPSNEYKELSAKLISDPAHAALKAKTDAYYEIQKNASERIKQYVANGMDIFVVSGYNLQLPGLVDSYALSSDNIIQSTSTSLGAVLAPAGEALPEDYVPVIDESYISPDRNVDAGAGALPDRTWFVKNQSHLKLQLAVDDTIELCVQILTNKSITDSRVHNGGYPQFNSYRNLVPLKYNLHIIEKLTQQQLDSYSDATRAELQSVYNAGQDVIKQKVWDDSYIAVEKQLETLLDSLGLVYQNTGVNNKPDTKITITKVLSELCNKTCGAHDFYSFF
ncbi:hypothetical protein SDC9_132866 [bioreactor metagenome]|uniref:Uncharacterized protein n=1 Tax=bioreactor metagenome TaxID=1076179 RepID=A0A645D8Z5_9ZZZZ